MSNHRILRWLMIAAVLVTAACSGDEGTTPGDDASDADPFSADDDGTNAGDTTDGEPAEPLFAGLDATVTLRTEMSGGGHRPLLEWEPVADADHYSTYLYAPDGEVYWVWSGRGTSVHVGGDPQLRDEASGPSVTGGMTWAVIAHDAAGLPLAVSEQRPIAP